MSIVGEAQRFSRHDSVSLQRAATQIMIMILQVITVWKRTHTIRLIDYVVTGGSQLETSLNPLIINLTHMQFIVDVRTIVFVPMTINS